MTDLTERIASRIADLEIARTKHKRLVYVLTEELAELKKLSKRHTLASEYDPALTRRRYENERTRLLGALLPPEE